MELFDKGDIQKFDSNEEIYFTWWLEEAKKHGVVKRAVHHPEPFQLLDSVKYEVEIHLATKVRYEERELLKGMSYTCDFYVEWDKRFQNYVYAIIDRPIRNNSVPFFAQEFETEDGIIHASYIEVKGTFGGKHKSEAMSTMMRKMCYDKFKIFVQMIKIGQGSGKGYFFESTFTPMRFLRTDGGSMQRKMHYRPLIVQEWIKRVDPKKHIFDD